MGMSPDWIPAYAGMTEFEIFSLNRLQCKGLLKFQGVVASLINIPLFLRASDVF